MKPIGMILAAVAVGAGFSVRAGAELSGDGILAIINDEVITERDFDAQVSALMSRIEDSSPLADADQHQMRRGVLMKMVEERLLVQEAKRLGLTVEPEEVAGRLRELQEDLATPEAYAQMLSEANLTEERLKIKLREQLLVQQVIAREVRSRIVVSPAEIASAMGEGSGASPGGEEVRAYHLLIRVTQGRSAEEAMRMASEAYDALATGAEFEETARRYADGPDDPQEVLLGWVPRGHLLPELDQVVFQLQPGELSTPIQTRLGFHVVKLLERRTVPADVATTRQEAVRRQLYQQKFQQALSEWLSKLKDKAYIEIVADNGL